MADKKISELEFPNAIRPNDLLLFVTTTGRNDQLTNTKLELSGLFGNIPSPIAFNDGINTVSDANNICTVSETISHVEGSSVGEITTNLDNGKQGQLKVLTMTSQQGFPVTVSGENIAGVNSISFNNVGDTLTLMFTNSPAGSNWIILSSHGVTIQ